MSTLKKPDILDSTLVKVDYKCVIEEALLQTTPLDDPMEIEQEGSIVFGEDPCLSDESSFSVDILVEDLPNNQASSISGSSYSNSKKRTFSAMEDSPDRSLVSQVDFLMPLLTPCIVLSCQYLKTKKPFQSKFSPQ